MYYPLLRARQFELIALRELVAENLTQGFITPILEPVKKTHNNLKIAFDIFAKKQQRIYLVANPIVGETKGDSKNILDFLHGFRPESVKVAFYYNQNASFINTCIDEYELDECMLLCDKDISTEDLEFEGLLSDTRITHVNVESPDRNRSLNRLIKSHDKVYIRRDDLFEKQNRNSDFLDIQEHRFSEEHIFYREEGFSGFSDYSVLSSEYSDTGSTPRAVVIHLTYLNGQNQIWVRHFTSVTNDSIANVQGKFAEAAEKAVKFCRDMNFSNSAIAELENYFDEQRYPGLGTVKKISIKNHLIVVRNYLNSI